MLNAESVYQQHLINKGIELAEEMEGKNLLFDIQGHVLLEIKLEDADYTKIIDKIEEQSEIEKKSAIQDDKEEPKKEHLERLLGSDITPITFASLDIKGNATLIQKFLVHYHHPHLNRERGSLIPLLTEMLKHTYLKIRVLELDQENIYISDSMRGNMLNNIKFSISDAVRNEVNVAIDNSLDTNGNIDYNKLNAALDQSREKLSETCNTILAENIARYIEAEHLDVLKNKLIKKSFKKTAATTSDYLGTDIDHQTATRITGTDKTAHNKQKGDNTLAIRRIIRHNFENGDVIDKRAAYEFRVPSIAVKELEGLDAVDDVVIKLDELAEGMKRASGKKGFTYNLLTSLYSVHENNTLDRTNKQTESAGRILKGAHKYNLKAMSYENFIYIQNIPVNKHGNALGYGGLFSSTRREATVMAEFSMLATMYSNRSNYPDGLKLIIEDTFINYVGRYYAEFLISDAVNVKGMPGYFCNSEYGKEAIKILKNFKQIASQNIVQQKVIQETQEKDNQELKGSSVSNDEKPATLRTFVSHALLRMVANDQHFNLKYGMIIQAFSQYIEQSSVAGCKSANERHHAVSSMVDMLRSIENRNYNALSKVEKNFFTELVNFANGKSVPESGIKVYLPKVFIGKEPVSSVKALDAAISIAVSKENYQGAVTTISIDDQGANAKLQNLEANTSLMKIIKNMDTNRALSKEFKVYAKNANSMQAHKGDQAGSLKQAIEIAKDQTLPPTNRFYIEEQKIEDSEIFKFNISVLNKTNHLYENKEDNHKNENNDGLNP